MTYPYYAAYNTCGWEDGLSLLSQEQTTAAHMDASGPPAVYPSGYPTQQINALWYEPVLPTIEPEWAPHYPQLGYAMAGPPHVAHDDFYFPQQTLLAEESNHQVATIAYSTAYYHERLASPLYLPCNVVQPQYGAVHMSGGPVAGPSTTRATIGERIGARYTPYQQRPRLEVAVVGPGGIHEAPEGATLHQTTSISRKSARRNDTTNGLIPEAVQASGEGRTHPEVTRRAPRMDMRQTPYLSSDWNCHKCKGGFGRVHELKRHLNTAKAHVAASLTCDECKDSATFSRPDVLFAHKRTFHGWP
ncbi:hypothetical protein HETIRDRAFT_311941 [Heterobasidion irregulare TC 32-1]|uniref:C2H2-type domain-containing protein n=1 Tax=Heterobasidion irregulare (strain TC 32-1) TaxID=747525 RepID=W4KG95_HETIT|nr:uncharacterized protein HETIRDRAFT_311941 [Heterobasidion irregulare TC 32-1]ETW84878.1 hypothetical protein HETIRDRAFT_311941 [Heterobasidion irregulare TC 32-1]